MSGSNFGKQFSVSTWGESHGTAIGAVVDGCPAGVPLSEQFIQADLDRRRPGTSVYASSRAEPDAVRICSGIFEGKTTGTPISLVIQNQDQRPTDYAALSQIYRPGHADFTYDQKYGFRDYRGGGRSSGRETAGRVAAGAVAKAFLNELHIKIHAYTIAIGSVGIDRSRFDPTLANPLCMPDPIAYEQAKAEIECAVQEGDSLGGVVECVIAGAKPGIGEPVFDKLQAVLGHAIFSIGAVKGVEFGAGFAAAGLKGSENNISKNTGGSYGGITAGSEILFRVAFKPTPSISKTQETINKRGEKISVNIQGRHDPVIVPRAVVVVEAMSALALADLLLQSLLSRMDSIQKLWEVQT